jgi:hypothetical protein
MSCIKYKDFDFKPATITIINQAVEIIEEYAAEGYNLTLRQLYYQFVARDIIENKQSEYKRLGNIINDARLAGMIDWNAIEDRTRNLRKLSHWESPKDILVSAAESYHEDLWKNQDYRIEVWIEKDALVGVIEGICEDLDVPYFSCRGYVSQSEMWNAAQRIIRYEYEEKQPIVLHLGDHDPSGLDMTRDIQDRLFIFNANVKVIRIALNEDQIKQYNPPPNPAKITDSRYNNYTAIYGDKSWELDALEPKVLSRLIDDTISNQYIDLFHWQTARQKIENNKKRISDLAENWQDQ